MLSEGQASKPQCYPKSLHSSPLMLSGPINSDPNENRLFFSGDSKRPLVINVSEVDNPDKGDSTIQRSLSHPTFMLSRQPARKCDVKMVPAQPPVDMKYLIGNVEVRMFDERGGVFHSYKHGVTVEIPAGAIPSGILAELKFAATLVAPVTFSGNKTPVSAVYWLCMGLKVKLHKPIQIWLPLMGLKNASDELKFAKSLHSRFHSNGDQMEVLDDGNFPANKHYASIQIDHFCYYCIVKNSLKRNQIPNDQYSLVAMKQQQPNSKDNSWNFHICLVPNLRTCKQYLKEQYKDEGDWEYKELLEFSFENNSEMKIELVGNAFGSAAKVDVLSDMKIKQEDVDFGQYYSDDRIEELKDKMDRKLYPPRCKARVKAKNQSFFITPLKNISIQITCNAKCIDGGKIEIPCIKNDSNHPPCNPPRQRRLTSGYESDHDDILESSSDNNRHVGGKLQLENLMMISRKAKDQWFELGIALEIDLDLLTDFDAEYEGLPLKALARVYQYWLADENGLQPTWDKLITALKRVNHYTIATKAENMMKQNEDVSPYEREAEPDESHMKNLVLRHVQPDLLDVTTLLPWLNKYLSLGRDDNYILLNRMTPPTERAMALLYTMLPKHGPEAYAMFVKCLQDEKQHLGHQKLAQLLHKCATGFQIFIKTPDERIIILEVEASDTIGSIKEKIHDTEKIPLKQQHLMFAEKLLQDEAALSDYNIQKESILCLCMQAKAVLQIFIITPTEKLLKLEVEATDTIGSIKAKIQDKAQIPHYQQQLIFAKKVLQDEATLSSCNIQKESILYLMIKIKDLSQTSYSQETTV